MIVTFPFNALIAVFFGKPFGYNGTHFSLSSGVFLLKIVSIKCANIFLGGIAIPFSISAKTINVSPGLMLKTSRASFGIAQPLMRRSVISNFHDKGMSDFERMLCVFPFPV